MTGAPPGDEAGPGDEPSGDEAGPGDEPSGDEPSGDEPSGDESSGDESSGDESSGNESSGDEPGEPPGLHEPFFTLLAICPPGQHGSFVGYKIAKTIRPPVNTIPRAPVISTCLDGLITDVLFLKARLIVEYCVQLYHIISPERKREPNGATKPYGISGP